ncbi:MAG: tetratricopeptide repeat protein [Planctomycetia bacterium]|nr:tetratricopeptide repeat protein [Planctomycetia bacterium]
MRRTGKIALIFAVLWVALSLEFVRGGAKSQRVAEARKLLLTGHYDEAAEALGEIAAKPDDDDDAVEAAIGLAECQASTGKADEALKTLQGAAQKHPADARLHAQFARRSFDKGDYAGAQQAVDAALKADGNSLLARWIQAELFRTSGKLKEAEESVAWFVTFYNDEKNQAKLAKDPEGLRWLGVAVAQHARWSREQALFRDIVNTVLPDAVAAEPAFWPAHYETGVLFLEKYNQAEATRSFNAALKINPQAAEVYAALAELALQNYDLDKARRSLDRALAINPNLAQAHALYADWHLANFQRDKARESLQKALAANPLSEMALARLAALEILTRGLPQDTKGTELGKITDAVEARNAHAGEFYFEIGVRLADQRRFDAAERFFKLAIEKTPKLIGPQREMGLMFMRLAREEEAKKLLEDSFQSDPFNVRVKNTLEVLDVLSGYATLETEHFIVRFDRGQDEILARYAAAFLENEVYPELTKQFGFEPQGKSMFEIFNRAKNSDGHAWFSARMVGLPYLGTVGACAGKIVAMTSPTGMEEPFNWARVLKHEFVHVLNLQQTNFNIPHWFTEGLATHNENYPRPESWNQILAQRMADKKLFTLEDVNLGFIRPQSGDDWSLAYCQSELYIEYMLATYGDDAVSKMLAALADNLDTPGAIKRSFGVEVAEFEKGYMELLKTVVAEAGPANSGRPEMTLAQLQEAVSRDAKNPDLLAQLALVNLEREDFPKARQSARAALAIKPKHALAAYVLARTHVLVGENDEAQTLLEECLDEKSPHPRVLLLLAGLKLKGGDTAGAEKLYELGNKAFPQDSKWLRALAGMYLRSGDAEKLAPRLEELAAREADEMLFRKKLAQIALARKDYAQAGRWAAKANHINVLDAEIHELWAAAHVGEGKLPEAIVEYETAIRLRPKKADTYLALADVCRRAGQIDKARQVLQDLLQREPKNDKAQAMLEELKP